MLVIYLVREPGVLVFCSTSERISNNKKKTKGAKQKPNLEIIKNSDLNSFAVLFFSFEIAGACVWPQTNESDYLLRGRS